MNVAYLLVAVSTIYLLYASYTNWGTIFQYRGLTEPFIKKGRYDKEETCRLVLEDFFGVPFRKCRPDFLKNETTGKNLELDGFSAEIPTRLGLGLGFEFNGPQHYFFTPKYHRDEADFQGQLLRDKLKKALCIENGVMLLVIPYTAQNIETYIMDLLRRNDLYCFRRRPF